MDAPGPRRTKLTVETVMTRDVVSVQSETPFKDVVERLRLNRISAVPVLDRNRRPIGLVSEADILLKAEKRGEDGYLLESRKHRGERSKARGVTAGEVMTTPVIPVRPDAPVAEVARMMHSRAIRRMPVVDGDGRLIGMVSRADLLEVFLRTDDEVKAEVTEVLTTAANRFRLRELAVEVADSVVTLRGEVQLRSQVGVVGRMVGALDGVVGVRNLVRCRTEDGVPFPTALG